MSIFSGEPLVTGRQLTALRRVAMQIRQLREEASRLQKSPSLCQQVSALQLEAHSLVEGAFNTEGVSVQSDTGESIAHVLRRRVWWLRCDEIIRAAEHLARTNLACKEQSLLQCLDILEPSSQHFNSPKMATEAWVLHTQEKLNHGAVESITRDFAVAGTCMDAHDLVQRICEFVTARIPDFTDIISALSSIQDRVINLKVEQLLHLIVALVSVDAMKPDESFTLALVRSFAPYLTSLQPMFLARLCWAIARLRSANTNIIEALADAASLRRKDFVVKDLVMSVCALARLSCFRDGFARTAAADSLVDEVLLRAARDSLSPADAARLSCSFALIGVEKSVLYNKLGALALYQQRRSLLEVPFVGDTACSHCCPRALPLDWPVQVINLDRSPERRAAMVEEVSSLGIVARRLPAIDGNSRIQRASSLASIAKHPDAWLKDLPDFHLGEGEPQPTLGLALTSQCEQHYVGYVGSFLSHISATRSFVEEGFPFTVVLEDDQTLHPDFNDVVNDIVACAGDKFDVVNLGPLDWRYRTLEYAQKRKLMTLKIQVPDPSHLRTEEEVFMDEILHRKPHVLPETNYFLYWIGSSLNDPESAGSAGAWGYMVSRAGSQKLAKHMNFMWESYDDQMQALLQGADVFSKDVGDRRLWAVYPPLVTSDGTWPSANVGDDMLRGRQTEPVSPHSSFRDRTLFHPMAKLILGPLPARGNGNAKALSEEELLKIGAMAMVWPSVGPEWVFQPTGWRSLFEHRKGSHNELQKELQIQIQLRPDLMALATESLAYAWTILGSARLLNITSRKQLRVLVVNPGPRECFCPYATFRDLVALASSVTIILAGPNAHHQWNAAEDLNCFRCPEDGHVRVERFIDAEIAATTISVNLAVAFGASLDTWRGPLVKLLQRHVPVVATVSRRESLVEGLQQLEVSMDVGTTPVVHFAGQNAFRGLVESSEPPAEDIASIGLGRLPGAVQDEKDEVWREARRLSRTSNPIFSPMGDSSTAFCIALSGHESG